MAQIYQGPYAHRIGYHEGYAAQILADGTHSDHWVTDETAYECHQAACDCGWRGNRYPAGPRGEELALTEWERAHLRPLVDAEARQHSIRADLVLRFANGLRGGLTEETDEHGRRVLTAHSRGLLDAVEHLEDFLDYVAGD